MTLTLGPIKNGSGPMAAPGESATVTVKATLLGLPQGSTPSLVFTGDTTLWPSAHVPMTSKKGQVYTFTRSIAVPSRIGRHTLSWSFSAAGSSFGAPIASDFEVTCSNGKFCDGEERWTKRGCVGGPKACPPQAGTTVACNETLRTCVYTPKNGAAVCAAKNCNPQCGPHQECGDDGCGGKCVTSATDAAGTCNVGSCVDQKCQHITVPGSCAVPAPLFGTTGLVPDVGTRDPATNLPVPVVLFGNSANGIDTIKLNCGGDGIKEWVYHFTVNVPMGVDIRALAADGNPEALDTVMAVHEANCGPQVSFPGFCSDDATPPSGLGSRVYGNLPPGTYALIVSGYSSAQVGPFQLQAKFTPGCVPACDGKFCGADGCGGDCGSCAAGQVCNATTGRCALSGGACEGKCLGKQCGFDECGNSCGTCAAGDLCAEADGKCVGPSGCDHLKPECGNCPPKSYCGTDCRCHPIDRPIIDLIPAPAATLLPSIEFEWRTFEGSSCALAEGCVPGPGRWLLMRFTTDILNQGLAGFKPGDPLSNPELFSYHACHQHYHFSGFANYALRSLDGASVLVGRKLSYCMEDSYQHLLGPSIPCAPASTCEDQGIQAGWADSYPNTLDCQWLALRQKGVAAPTDVPSGQWYLHETCTNAGRAFHEYSFDNNCVRIPVYIPDVPDNGQILKYRELTLPPAP